MNDYLTRDQAAEYLSSRGLRVSAGYLAKLATAGKGPSYSRLGKYAYYQPSDLDAWLKTNLTPVTAGRTSPKAA